MPELPWEVLRPPEPSRTYLALLTYLPLKSFWRIPHFSGLTVRILGQLKASPGALGYAMLARPLQKEFWTLSVWEDHAALMAFVRHPPHARVMKALAPHLGRTRFVQWDVKGSNVPPAWQEAFSRSRA